MSITISKTRRAFSYNGRTLPDPDPSATAEEVLRIYSGGMPELTNARVIGPQYDEGVETYTIKSITEHKG